MMRVLLFVALFVSLYGQKSIHIFVALCDNEHQGIVPVAEELGDGEDPDNNLYWGAPYGVRTYFARSDDWQLLLTLQDSVVLERCIFKLKDKDVYLVADAYKGSAIRQTVLDFLTSAFGNNRDSIKITRDSLAMNLAIGAGAELIGYLGHNGLMDFVLNEYPKKVAGNHPDVIILACMSKSYFEQPLKESGANPILWTTGLMAPEAYVLKAAIDGWVVNESGEKIRLRAAKAYHRYQKCGLGAAKKLFVSGW